MSDAAAAVLTTASLPDGQGAWTLHSDGTLNGVTGSRARVWSNSSPGRALEVDVDVLSSATLAELGWPTWKSKISEKASGQPSSCPNGAPSNCVEVSGVMTGHPSEQGVILTWQQTNVLVAVVLIDSQRPADAAYAEQVAAQEGQLISTVANG